MIGYIDSEIVYNFPGIDTISGPYGYHQIPQLMVGNMTQKPCEERERD